MSRRPNHIAPRKAIPKCVKIEVFERTGGMCARNCGRVGKEYNHKTAVALGGDNAAENIELLCRQCHKIETSEQVATIAKADRQGGRAGQYVRRQRAKKGCRHKSIQSRGFQTNRDSRFKAKIGGGIEVRS